MLGGEFSRRADNLKREQKQRAEVAQRKAEKEKIIQERLQKQRQAHEEDLRLKRIAEAAAAEEVCPRDVLHRSPHDRKPGQMHSVELY